MALAPLLSDPNEIMYFERPLTCLAYICLNHRRRTPQEATMESGQAKPQSPGCQGKACKSFNPELEAVLGVATRFTGNPPYHESEGWVGGPQFHATSLPRQEHMEPEMEFQTSPPSPSSNWKGVEKKKGTPGTPANQSTHVRIFGETQAAKARSTPMMARQKPTAQPITALEMVFHSK